MSGKIYHPDCSAYQTGIDLAGWLAVLVKATEGTGYRSGQYATQKAEAASHGAFFGGYHFLHAGNGAGQADYCFNVVGRGVPLMIDVEPTSGSNPTVADTAAFCDRYRALGGTTHLLYLPGWYWDQLGRPSLKPLADRHLHLVTSRYGAGDPENASHPGWASYGGMPTVYTLQYTATAATGGCAEVDLNCFRGSGSTDTATTLAELKSLWTTGTLDGGDGTPTLTEGDSGPAVTTAQHRLNLWGASPRLAEDGQFGPATTAAVRAFQQAHGLAADGIIGTLTWTALNKPPAGQLPAPTSLIVDKKRLALTWNPVTAPAGTTLTGYTIAVNGLDGKPYAQVTVPAGQHWGIVNDLVPGWTYNIRVWPNGGKIAPEAARLTVTLPT